MSTHKTSDIEQALMSKGFKKVNTHHEMYWLHVGSKKTSIRTRVSNGEREYGDKLLSIMARQVHLSRSLLDDLIECPLTSSAYLEELRIKGILRP